MRQTIQIFQGDATTLTEEIVDLDSSAGYTATLYIVDGDGDEVDTITGTIDDLEITYEIENDDSKAYPVGNHSFETKIYDDSDHVYTLSYGRFIVDTPINTEPNPEVPEE